MVVRSEVDYVSYKNTYVTHRSCPEKLRRLGISLDGRLEEAVNLVASMFKIIDDILDENTIRDNRPALWVERGFVEAVYTAVAIKAGFYALDPSILREPFN